MLASIFIKDVLRWNSVQIKAESDAETNETENNSNYNINELVHTRAQTPDLNDEIFRDNEDYSEMAECF